LEDEIQQINLESQEIIEQMASLEADIGNIDIRNTSTQSRVKSLQDEISKSIEIKEKHPMNNETKS